jgi:hypothetical protein
MTLDERREPERANRLAPLAEMGTDPCSAFGGRPTKGRKLG